MFTDNDTIQDAKSLLEHIAHAIYEANNELELGASQIDEIVAELRGVGNLPEEDEQFADALGDLGRGLYRHVRALRNEMGVMFETKLESPRQVEDEYERPHLAGHLAAGSRLAWYTGYVIGLIEQ